MNNQRLIIRISSGSLLLSTTNGGDVVFERCPVKSSMSMAANLREAFRTIPLLQTSYGGVTVLSDSPVLMVPVDIFRDEECDEQYRYVFGRQQSMAVVSHVLPELNAVALFALSKDLLQVLRDRFSTIRLQPVMAAVWSHFHLKSFTGMRQKLYGYYHDQRMEVFAFHQHRFRFYNAYAVGQNPNDALYYLLSVWKQLGLDPREDELHLSGVMPGRDQLADESRRFVKRVFMGNPSGEFNRAPVTQLEGMPYDMMLCYLKKG